MVIGYPSPCHPISRSPLPPFFSSALRPAIVCGVSFFEKLNAARTRNQSRICVSLDIVPALSPAPILAHDEPMLPFVREIVAATRDLVCAYLISPAYFWAEGAAGIVALERIVRLIPQDVPYVMDARIADPNTAELYARGAFDQFKADAISVANLDVAQILSERDVLLCADAIPQKQLSPRMGALYDHASDVPDALANACAPIFVRGDDVVHPFAVCCIGRPILYASRRIDFAEVARQKTLDLRARLGS